MLKDDLIRIRHMLDSAREAIFFAQNKTRIDLETIVMAMLIAWQVLNKAAYPQDARFQIYLGIVRIGANQTFKWCPGIFKQDDHTLKRKLIISPSSI